jgi:hypothetical protein
MTMKRTKEKKTRELRVHMTASEYAALQIKWRETTHRTFSDYIRNVLDGEPVVKRYRNQSLDDLLEVLVGIKNRLEDIRPDSAGKDIGDIKTIMIKIYEQCVREDKESRG